MKLIPEWKSSWRLFSVQAAGLLTVLSLLQAEILPQLESSIPPKWWPWITAAFGAGIIILRVVSQLPQDEEQ
jgi:hypothetical protein